MNTCDACQAQLLDHVYGLLDDVERGTLLMHLESCAACRAALAQAQAQRSVLAAAAKLEFPTVRFVPPATPAPARQPQVLPLTPARPSRRRVLRWAVAAGIVLVVGGMAALGGLSWAGHRDELRLAQAKRDEVVKERENVLEVGQQENTRSQQKIREIQDKITELENRWKQDLSKEEEAAAKKSLKMTVSGQRDVEPGAPNEYEIETWHNRRGGKDGVLPPAPAQVEAKVVDPASRAVYFTQHIASQGNCRVVLPRDLPIKPGKELVLEVTARTEGGVEARVTEQLPILGTLYLTHLTTDRPMYRPGEVVRFRSLTLERFSLKPAQEDFELVYRVTDPTGAEVFKLEGKSEVTLSKGQGPLRGPDGKTLRGIGAGDFTIPPGAAGGEYTLTVSDAKNRFPAERRKFLVNQYQAPRLNKELELTRKSYGPGDPVEASCKVSRVEGGKAVVNQPVVATASVDGKPVATVNLRTDAWGNVPPIHFRLPPQMDRGQGSLAVQLTDGANHETIVRPIPIVLKKLFMDFYPEGGDLVAGVPCRVYFQARTTLNKPAELQGRLVDQTGRVVTAVRTLADDKELGVNQGMGRFEFTPEAGQRYELKIDVPIGIEGRYVLPAVQDDGVVLSVAEGVVTDKIDVYLHSGRKTRRLLVGAYCRGRVLQHAKAFAAPREPAHVCLTPTEAVGGVYRITVFEERGVEQRRLVPVAERLIYRRPAQRLELGLKTDKKSYSPGAPVTMTCTADNEQQQPAPAVVLFSVVDQGIIKLADEKTARSMPAHFFLTTEVKKPEDLEYADFLLGDHPKAAQALDLLLGTQGWRRFAEQDPAQFRQKEKQDAERLLLASAFSAPVKRDAAEEGLARVHAKYLPLHNQKEAELAQKEAEDDEQKTKEAAALATLQARLRQAERAIDSTDEDYRENTRRLLYGGLGVLAAILLLVGFGGLAVSIVRSAEGRRRAAPYGLAGVAALLLLLFVGASAVVFHELGTTRQEQRLASAATRSASGPAERKAGEAVPEGGAAGVDFDLADQLKEEVAKAGGGTAKEVAPPPPGPPDANLAVKEKGKQLFPEAREPQVVPAMLDDAAVKLGKDMPQLPPGKLDPAAPLAGLAQQLGDKQLVHGGGQPLGMPGPPGFPFGPPGGGPMNMNGGFGGFGGLGGGKGPGGLPGGMNPNFAGFAGGQFDVFNAQRGGEVAQEQERLLRRQGQYGVIAAWRMQRPVPVPAPAEPLVVRTYAHHHPTSTDNVRRDFAETVCWQPVLVVKDGKGQVAFDLPDSATRFQVVAWGHTLDGRLGAATMEFASRLPFSLEPKVPTEITYTDKVIIPVTVANDTDQRRNVQVQVSATELKLTGKDKLSLAVAPEQRLRQLLTFQPTRAQGQATLTLLGRCEPFGVDAVERSFKIVPEGFPFVGSKSDLLEGTAQQTITLPESWVKGTLELKAQVFPSTLADLQKGLEALLREPGGCFEQSSSSNYPNVLILNYLKESDQARPEVEQDARRKLATGYRQLTSFECIDPRSLEKRQGYEWFGQTAPPHEALTAYGLLEFHDMARVHPVDKAMLERTRKYLLDQRDGKGGFKRNPRALDSFGRAPDHITNAYIVWALSEAGDDNLDVELKALVEKARDSKDSYFLALVGNGLVNRGRTAEALDVLKRLGAMQKADGHLEGAQTSITSSGGRDLEIETTALATLAWLKANRPADLKENVEKAARWLGRQRGGFGGFGSTQSTILALKALIGYTAANRRTAEAGELKLFVGDLAAPVAVKAFPAGTQEALVVSLPREELLRPGKNSVRLEMTGKNRFPYTLSWTYNTLKPANPEGCPVHLTAALDRETAKEGETVQLHVTVENRTGKGQGMAVAVLGLPGGLALPEDMKQLKEMARLRDNDTKPGEISAFEIRGRELVLYWRDLAPDQKIDVSVDLVCRVPGEYRGPASRAYLYYNADRKYWVAPLSLNIRPQAQ
jgi:hypothetical protein